MADKLSLVARLGRGVKAFGAGFGAGISTFQPYEGAGFSRKRPVICYSRNASAGSRSPAVALCFCMRVRLGLPMCLRCDHFVWIRLVPKFPCGCPAPA